MLLQGIVIAGEAGQLDILQLAVRVPGDIDVVATAPIVLKNAGCCAG
jgi:hypothetical protein